MEEHEGERAFMESMSSSCHCPEVEADGEWIPFCDYRMGRLDGELPPGARSAEPVGWRCPQCAKGIIRTGVQLAQEGRDQLEYLLDLDEIRPRGDDDPWLRIDFRCCSPACSWSDFVLTRAAEGLVERA